MKLSILIPTVVGREQEFDSLIAFLEHQKDKLSFPEDVEIVTLKDNKQLSIGAKRQILLEEAIGEYIAFIDDDDWVHDKYLEKITDVLYTNDPDCIGFKIKCIGTEGKIASASNKWTDWRDKHGGFDYVRTIYHKNPVRRSIALKIGFKDIRFAEDYDYSKRLKQSALLRNEFFMNEFMYIYQFTYQDPKIKYGIK